MSLAKLYPEINALVKRDSLAQVLYKELISVDLPPVPTNSYVEMESSVPFTNAMFKPLFNRVRADKEPPFKETLAMWSFLISGNLLHTTRAVMQFWPSFPDWYYMLFRAVLHDRLNFVQMFLESAPFVEAMHADNIKYDLIEITVGLAAELNAKHCLAYILEHSDLITTQCLKTIRKSAQDSVIINEIIEDYLERHLPLGAEIELMD